MRPEARTWQQEAEKQKLNVVHRRCLVLWKKCVIFFNKVKSTMLGQSGYVETLGV